MSDPRAIRTFLILGDLKAKARPRVTKHGNTYTPKTTRDAEAQAGLLFIQANPDHRPDGSTRWGIGIHVWPLTRRRADVDNLAKTIMDALNGVLYVDDGQVDFLAVHRHWGVPDKAGQATVTCTPLPPRED